MLQRVFSRGLKRFATPASRPRVSVKRSRLFTAMSAEAIGPKAQSIQQKLNEVFSPAQLEIVNESFKHNVPKGSETHFKVLIVSEEFEGKPLVEQHRMVNEILKAELQSGVHALSLKTMALSKWQATQAPVSHETPNCMGGSKK